MEHGQIRALAPESRRGHAADPDHTIARITAFPREQNAFAAVQAEFLQPAVVAQLRDGFEVKRAAQRGQPRRHVLRVFLV